MVYNCGSKVILEVVICSMGEAGKLFIPPDYTTETHPLPPRLLTEILQVGIQA